MSLLLERVRLALLPHYELEFELAAGAMGVVFAARDPTLDRRVAIKVLRPELATAVAAERFLREARLLATLSHPNIVGIHQAGEVAGIHYYVMDLIEGESLATRLRRGPLPLLDVVSLGAQLLDALEAVHRLGTVHRDVKPANIFMVGERTLLGDFGIAHTIGDATLTGEGQAVGTPAYMAPEQFTGMVSAQTDLFAVGMVLYEAATGRRWNPAIAVAEADWRGVPGRLAAPLRRSLAPAPENRWASAPEFRRALERLQQRAQLRLLGSLSMIVAAAALLVAPPGPLCRTLHWWPRCAAAAAGALPDLAIPPLAVGEGVEPTLGRDFAELLRYKLRGLPNVEVAHGDSTRARTHLEGQLLRQNDELVVTMRVVDSAGHRTALAEHRAAVNSWAVLPDSIGFDLVREVFPRWVAAYRAMPSLATKDFRALGEFLAGEIAFAHDAWTVAGDHYERALRIDPNFAQAAWRLADTRRWRRVPTEIDLAAVYTAHRHEFRPLDTLLIVAQLEPELDRRKTLYVRAAELYPHDFYAKFVYGNELFHRGPLSGLPIEHSLNILEAARVLNPRFGPVLNQVAWAYIRLGRRADAARALAQRDSISTPEGGDLDVGKFLRLAYLYRFAPDSAAAGTRAFLGNANEASVAELSQVLRMAPSFDIPNAQLAIGGQLAAAPGAAPLQQANGHIAQALALIAMARPAQGLAQLDSARLLSPTDEARLQVHEWRLLLPVLGAGRLPREEVDRGRQVLQALVSDNRLGVRAAWALGTEAYASHDAPALERWLGAARRRGSGSAAAWLVASLQAMRHALEGDHRRALDLSRPLLATDSAARTADPFARAILYRQRALWYEQIDQPQEAEREWLWYENSDFPGWLEGDVHAVEIDWAVGTFASLERSRVLRELGDVTRACQLARRLAELWVDSEPNEVPLRDRAVAQARNCPP